MTPVRFGVQALVVLALVVLVSWPEHRRLRAVTIWRTNGPLAGDRAGAAGDPRFGGTGRGRGSYQIGYGSAYAGAGSGRDALTRKLYDNDLEGRRLYTTPYGVLALGGTINALHGFARTALNTPIPFARLVLRNISTGLIEARATADEEGRFLFLDVFPSGYIVELLGTDGSVVATSELVPLALGDLRQTTIRVAAVRGLTATFGNTLEPTAYEPITAAADSGVGPTTPQAPISPSR